MDTFQKEIRIKMVVCDMAGTTVHEDNIVYKTLLNAINKVGYDFTLEQVLRVGAGKEKKEAIRSVIAAYSEKAYEPLVETIFMDFLAGLEQAYVTSEISAQPNATDFFKALKTRGIKVVLNTGYDKKTASSLLNKLNWEVGREIDEVVTADDVLNNRPQPDMILLAMRKFGLADGSSVVKVGDSTIDIEEGQNAGCVLNIGITTGAHTRQQLAEARPSSIVGNLMEILPIIDTF